MNRQILGALGVVVIASCTDVEPAGSYRIDTYVRSLCDDSRELLPYDRLVVEGSADSGLVLQRCDGGHCMTKTEDLEKDPQTGLWTGQTFDAFPMTLSGGVLKCLISRQDSSVSFSTGHLKLEMILISYVSPNATPCNEAQARAEISGAYCSDPSVIRATLEAAP